MKQPIMTQQQREGLLAGTHRISDDGKSVVEKTAVELLAYKQNALRARREKECFPIINRGQPWYDRLTEEQRAEVNSWYSAWLDVTDTLVAPEKPTWIK